MSTLHRALFGESPPSGRNLFAIVAAVTAVQLVVWVAVAATSERSFIEILNYWDAAWYTKIVDEGYSGELWAFFPAYPALLATLKMVGGFLPTQVLGAVLSFVLFLLFVCLVSQDKTPGNHRPQNLGEWLCFTLAPASYIFHSNHTESLFLLVTMLAVFAWYRGHWWVALLWGSLATLVRIQGSLLALALGLAHLLDTRVPLATRIARFVAQGVTAFACLSVYLGYQYYATGDALAFLAAHDSWAHGDADNVLSWVRAFWFGNPWQEVKVSAILHYAHFWVLLAIGVFLWRNPRDRLLALYILFSASIVPIQGEFVDVFRFAAVLPPVYFVLLRWARFPALQTLLLAGMLVMNLAVTYAYAVQRWAY
jgi:Gpi18-like mannosyltransferase